MLALQLFEQGMCRKCGHNLDDTTNPDHDPDNSKGSRMWVSEGHDKCFACLVLARNEKNAANDDSIPHPEALIYTAVLVDRPPRQSKPRRAT